jgi:hypothetical protein
MVIYALKVRKVLERFSLDGGIILSTIHHNLIPVLCSGMKKAIIRIWLTICFRSRAAEAGK